jgi:hypothetical protein
MRQRIAAAEATGDTEWLHTVNPQGQSWASLLDGAVLDLAGLQQSELFWATRDLVDLALAAAESLPEWSPSAAMPSDFGIVGWSKPIGSFDWPVPGSDQVVRMPIDAMSWGTRNESVGVTVGFRWDRPGVGERLAGLLDRTPLVMHASGVWDLYEPVAHRTETGAVAPLSVLGSLWLLASQPRVTTHRKIAGAGSPPAPSPATGATPQPATAPTVSLIDIRKARAEEVANTPSVGGKRAYTKQWWCRGFWRNQAYGPGRALRRPLWIEPHIRGPADKPLAGDGRVFVVRR